MNKDNIATWLDKHAKYVLTIPALLFVLLMVVFPLIYTIVLSMLEWNLTTRGGATWNNFQNYTELLSSERFWKAAGRTFMFSFGSVSIQVILGVALALFLHRAFYGKNFVKTLILLPMITTPVAIAMVWLLIFEPNIGLANNLLGLIGIDPQMWLASSKTVMGSLIMIDVWQQTPLIMLVTLAGLSSLPTE
ncbi:MAG: sugar ABC transporter permease, partial [Spirochaetia bacterium]|nr:sugar ABC transporter permease [Spirochaetia bacterium]